MKKILHSLRNQNSLSKKIQRNNASTGKAEDMLKDIVN